LSQSLALARLLRQYKPTHAIVGVLIGNESVGSSRAAYDNVCQEKAVVAQAGDILVPTGAESTEHLIKLGGAVTLGGITLDAESMRFSDKIWSLNLANSVDVPIPRTWQNAEEIDRWPIFYKNAFEGGIRARGVARSVLDIPQKSGLIYQELIDGVGVYGVGFIAKDGQIICLHSHYESVSYPASGGSAAILGDNRVERVEELTRAIVQASSYSGWGLAEFKFCTRRRDYVFMEINSKFWASWEMALLNEPCFLKLLFDISSHEHSVSRIVFIERAMRLGPSVWSKVIAEIKRGAVIRAYPGWPRQIAAAFIPTSLIRRLKKGP
jgi:hypothetical protein